MSHFTSRLQRAGRCLRAIGISTIIGLVSTCVGAAPLPVDYAETVLHSFSGFDGARPTGELVETDDGAVLGTTSSGGTAGNFGTVFRIDADGRHTVLHEFAGSDGANPNAGLVRGPDGAYYGTTGAGGAAGLGTVFRIAADGSGFANLHSFGDADGAAPASSLMLASDGNFYGTTFCCGSISTSGSVFRMTPAGVVTNLYRLRGGVDGSGVYAGLVEGPDGALYGAALTEGGADNAGTVFRVTKAGQFSVLHTFTATGAGSGPSGGLLFGSDGSLFGTTAYAGPAASDFNRGGTVFRLAPNGSLSVLRGFSGDANGGLLFGGLSRAASGRWYGTTFSGGSGNGVVYSLANDGSDFRRLYAFRGTPLAANPYAGVLESRTGDLVGTSFAGGQAGMGSVYRLRPFTPAPTVSFASAALDTPPANLRGDSVTTVGVTLSYAPTSTVTVPVTVGGSEPASRYRVSPAGSVTFAPGQTTANITVTVTAPALLQCERTIELTLAPTATALLGPVPTATVTIRTPAPLLTRLLCGRQQP